MGAIVGGEKKNGREDETIKCMKELDQIKNHYLPPKVFTTVESKSKEITYPK